MTSSFRTRVCCDHEPFGNVHVGQLATNGIAYDDLWEGVEMDNADGTPKVPLFFPQRE